MKMDIFFGNLFWGVLVILIGASIILKSFNVNIPLVKTFIAIIIILFGFKILFGSYKKTSRATFSPKAHGSTHMEYTSVFGSGTVDLSRLDPKIQTVEVTAVFGNAWVSLPDSIDFDVESNAIFGAVVTPAKTDAGLSSSRQTLGNGKRRVRVEATAVFGRVEFIVKDGMSNEAWQEEIVVEEEQNNF